MRASYLHIDRVQFLVPIHVVHVSILNSYGTVFVSLHGAIWSCTYCILGTRCIMFMS